MCHLEQEPEGKGKTTGFLVANQKRAPSCSKSPGKEHGNTEEMTTNKSGEVESLHNLVTGVKAGGKMDGRLA